MCVEELREVGFDVRVEDLHHDFIKILNAELSAFSTSRQAFINDFSKDDYNTLSSRWANTVRKTIAVCHVTKKHE